MLPYALYGVAITLSFVLAWAACALDSKLSARTGYGRINGSIFSGLFGTVDDTAFFQIVGCQFNSNGIAGHDANVVLSHFSGDMGSHNVPVLEFNSKHRVWQGLDNLALHLNCFFFCHSSSRLQQTVDIIVNLVASASFLVLKHCAEPKTDSGSCSCGSALPLLSL
jgi:hypothetical protein